ncbi:hypothetical protein [uncultured Shewanella sp.]|uniref:hypothetical protein n=1 Tax=uncultured Shewanella sp. TaxID=173975 RepID=UPI00261EBB37|nr:hypothetical protein [uncultured Shewanella sp.]
MEVEAKKFALRRCFSLLLFGMLSILGASNTYSVPRVNTTPNEAYVGYELMSRTVLNDERACETINQAKLDLQYSIILDEVYSQQREQKQLSFDRETAQLQLKQNQLVTLTNSRLERIQALLLANEHLERLQEETQQAKQLYRECTQEDCSAEYEHYKDLRSIEREYEQSTVNPLETAIADLDTDIYLLEGDIEDLEEEVADLAHFLSQADAAAADLSEKQVLYAATFESTGELTQLKGYGDIEAFDFISGARLLLHRERVYSPTNGVPIGIVSKLETLTTLLIGNVMPAGTFEWPLTNDTSNIATELHALLNQSFNAGLYIDAHYTCGISPEEDVETVLPTFSLMLNVAQDMTLLNQYRIHIDPKLAVDELAALINGVPYISTASLAEFSFSESAFWVEEITVFDETEANFIPQRLALDFLHTLLNQFAVPAPDLESIHCTSQVTTSGCQLAGWWLNGLGADALPNVAITPYSIELSDNIKLSEHIFLSMTKDAALPEVCSENEVLENGECVITSK